jgi:hypothetical protein
MENCKNNNSMYYNYAIKNILIKDKNMLNEIGEYLQIYLCIYRINTSGKVPFLEYLLSNNGYNLLTLPNLQVFNVFNKDNIISYSKIFLSGLLQVENFEELNKNIDIDGFYEYNENLYIFFDITNCDFNINDTYLSSPVRFALIDEIINHKNVCNIPINNDTSNFFIINESLNFIFDENNETYEIPIVGFVGKKTPEKINFTYIFGESPKDKLSMFGSNYYFTDFKNAIREGGWSNNYKPEYLYDKLITDNENGRYMKGGLVRFALFMGKTKYIENNENLPNDESFIKKDRLNDTNLNQKYEILTLRISDHDSSWKKSFDSLYLGNIELDDGSFIQEYPVIVTSDYNQQLCLSYHYINKNKLGEKFYSNDDYTIV